MVRRCLIVALYVLATFSCVAQPRVDGTSLAFKSQSKKLTSATGWKYNTYLSKWYSNKNIIDDRVTPLGLRSRVENFNWIQWKTLYYQDQLYYVLLFEYTTGNYTYQTIKEGWREFYVTRYTVFDSLTYQSALQKLDTARGTVQMFPLFSGRITGEFDVLNGEKSYTTDVMLSQITKDIRMPHEPQNGCFTFKKESASGQELVRFLLPGIYSNCYLNSVKFLTTEYYELPYKDFMVLFQIK